MEPGLPLLLGHRGARASKSVPENTPASFDLALTHGCDGFEFDVRLTADKQAVVCHDPQHGPHAIARSPSSRLADLPRLDEVLRRYGQRVFLDIELKVSGLESIVLAALRDHRPERGYVVSSFLPDVIMDLKVRSAAVPTGMICDKARQLAAWRKLPIDYVIVEKSLVKPTLVEEVHATGRKLFVWTVNDIKSMRWLARWGVDGIISDDTQHLVRTLRRPSGKPS
ncbi:MAG: glycerophosphodiester phosphodiesterase [Terriglobales bacterium]|jgi:glycerophosphoryl diester phosphodiesterase